MSSTSSEDSDLARFAAVAVTGNQIAEGAVKSAQNARKREIKAAQRRAGGGGVLGVRPDSDSDDGLLNAAQLKVADALHQRMKRELEKSQNDNPETSDSSSEEEGGGKDVQEERKEDLEEEEEDSDGGGVALFKNAPRVTKVLPRGGISGQGNGNFPGQPRPRSKGAAEASSDEEESTKRCRAAAVDTEVLIQDAKVAAEKARDLIMPVKPTSDDEGGKAKKRRRKRLKEEEESRKKAGKNSVVTVGAVETLTNDKEDGEQTPKKKKKKNKKKKESNAVVTSL